jgi:hypothetical protein
MIGFKTSNPNAADQIAPGGFWDVNLYGGR